MHLPLHICRTAKGAIPPDGDAVHSTFSGAWRDADSMAVCFFVDNGNLCKVAQNSPFLEQKRAILEVLLDKMFLQRNRSSRSPNTKLCLLVGSGILEIWIIPKKP